MLLWVCYNLKIKSIFWKLECDFYEYTVSESLSQRSPYRAGIFQLQPQTEKLSTVWLFTLQTDLKIILSWQHHTANNLKTQYKLTFNSLSYLV